MAIALAPDSATASVTVTLSGLGSVTEVSLYRVHPDGRRWPVRGFGAEVVNYPVSGSTMIFVDYEPPLGVPVQYQVNEDSDPPEISAPVQIPAPGDPNFVWLSNPGQPARNLLAIVDKAPDWTRGIDQAVYRPRGRTDPIVVSGVRHAPEGDLALYTWTADEEAAMDGLLASGSVLLIRGTPGWGLDYLYVAVGEVAEPRLVQAGWEPGRRWTLPLTVTARPPGGMTGSATRVWEDVLDDVETPTWGDVLAKYSSWLEVLQGV